MCRSFIFHSTKILTFDDDVKQKQLRTMHVRLSFQKWKDRLTDSSHNIGWWWCMQGACSANLLHSAGVCTHQGFIWHGQTDWCRLQYFGLRLVWGTSLALIMSSSFQWKFNRESLSNGYGLVVTMPCVTRREKEKKVGNVRPAQGFTSLSLHLLSSNVKCNSH